MGGNTLSPKLVLHRSMTAAVKRHSGKCRHSRCDAGEQLDVVSWCRSQSWVIGKWLLSKWEPPWILLMCNWASVKGVRRVEVRWGETKDEADGEVDREVVKKNKQKKTKRGQEANCSSSGSYLKKTCSALIQTSPVSYTHTYTHTSVSSF